MIKSQRSGGWRISIPSSVRTAAAAFIVAGTLFSTNQVDASAGDRALSIMHMHTREQATIVFKRNGRYDPEGLKKLNYILRDWRKNQPINMDPHLFDLIWEVYQKSGSHEPIHVVCGYRSPDTNNMLRARSRGVAKHSQHMLGKAMDFYIPDVPLTKLREIGFKMQMGGVGFYPTSGSPFVHMDTGSVRSWPRMSREQLVRLFPDGKTMHIPADGKPLPGYAQALAAYQSRKAGQGDIVMASASSGGGKSFLARLFGGGGADEEEDTADAGATSVKVAAAKGAAKAAADTGDDEGGDAAPAVAASAPAPLPTPKAVPAVDDAAPAETVVAMAPVPRPSPVPRADDAAADQTADASADTTEVAMAPVPRPSPVPRADDAEPAAPTVVADAAPLPLPKAAPVASTVAQPTVALASASASGAATPRPTLQPAQQQLAFQATPASAAPAAPHQPMTAAEAIADAVGQGNQGAAAVLAYAPADDGAARIDARTGAIVAGRTAKAQPKAQAPASSDAWQNPIARFTSVAFDNDAMALVIDPETLAESADGALQMPRPMPASAVFAVTKHSAKYGFGRVAAFRVLRADRQPASDTLALASNGN